MAATPGPAPGTDFWAALGVVPDGADDQAASAPPDTLVAGVPAADQSVPAEQSAPAAEQSVPAEQSAAAEQSVPATQDPPAGETVTEHAPEPVEAAPEPEHAVPPAVQKVPEAAAPAQDASRKPPAVDPAWREAGRIADAIRPRMVTIWLDLLTREADGDQAMARRVYHVMSGQHVLGELWLEPHISEVHIRGTRVTVCGTQGVYEVPGFPDAATAQRAVAAVKAAQGQMRANVTQVNDSIVVSRAHDAGMSAASLLTSGVLTEEQLSQVEQALERMQAVTVTGPAARIVVRALASLIPPGSRIFQGPLGVLPAGCVAASGPLDADYVVGVRPGPVAEQMAAAGQLGALIANPETQIRAAVRLAVSGRSAAPEKVTAL
ncbi:hypothetical protein GCM10023085_65530 [Actinomadura viridis]|uniref:Uncharacterized protein n=1 Tax=Actinomadura viridis TaxID=58110 RepID=A0A931DSG7_9ACTN|nr:hypothetical protein [Actinomadura viridis]MBG6093031.1 hypothetical protein [Actinomadura viridis]